MSFFQIKILFLIFIFGGSLSSAFAQKDTTDPNGQDCNNDSAVNIDRSLLNQASKIQSQLSRPSLAKLPVACVEDIAPSVKRREYQDALDFMKNNKNKTDDDYINSWSYVQAAKDSDEKIKLIYEAADRYNMPPLVLAGAMMQEMILADLALVEDFGNWACGMGQLNVNDWCSWAKSQSKADQKLIDWPSAAILSFQKKNPGVDVCGTDFIQPDHAKAFHSVILSRLQAKEPGTPDYMSDRSYTSQPTRIQFNDVKSELQEITSQHQNTIGDDAISTTTNEEASQNIRFLITRNFIEKCQDPHFAVPAMAHTLKAEFNKLPRELRTVQQFHKLETKTPPCNHVPKTNAYPLQIGWLLADAVYNAGSEILPGVYAYKKKSGLSWEQFGPQDLVNAIDFALKMKNSGISAIGAREAAGHIRGVVSSVTMPDQIIVK